MVLSQPCRSGSLRYMSCEKKRFSKEFMDRPDIKAGIATSSSMIDSDAKKRPTANKLLENTLFPTTVFTRQHSQVSNIEPSKFYALVHDGMQVSTSIHQTQWWPPRGHLHLSTGGAGESDKLLEHLFQLRGAVNEVSLVIKTRNVESPDSTMFLSGAKPSEPAFRASRDMGHFLDETPSSVDNHYEIGKVLFPGLGLEHPSHQFSVLYDCVSPTTSSELVDFDVLSAAWSLASMLASEAAPHFPIRNRLAPRAVHIDALLLLEKDRKPGPVVKDREQCCGISGRGSTFQRRPRSSLRAPQQVGAPHRDTATNEIHRRVPVHCRGLLSRYLGRQ